MEPPRSLGFPTIIAFSEKLGKFGEDFSALSPTHHGGGAFPIRHYVETDCTGSPSGTFNQRRTHTLSNGEVIWDLAGNVWEWTSYFNNSDKPYDATDGNPVASWREYTLIDTFGTMSQTDLISQAAVTGGWSTTESIGRYYAQVNGSGGALHRGGDWYSATNAGVFSANLYVSPTGTYSNVGFRCAVSAP